MEEGRGEKSSNICRGAGKGREGGTAQMKGVGGREWGKTFARSSFWQEAANARGEDGGGKWMGLGTLGKMSVSWAQLFFQLRNKYRRFSHFILRLCWHTSCSERDETLPTITAELISEQGSKHETFDGKNHVHSNKS